MTSERTGKYVMTLEGYKAYVPEKLPPEPPVNLDAKLITLLSAADHKLGRLDGVTQVLPNPDLFVAMYVRKEALLSSQIEGMQASLVDVLGATKERRGVENNVQEVINYVEAMNYALRRLDELPVSLRLIREIHAILLQSGRGSKQSAGEFRKTQNWIGHPGSTLRNATFVPPTVDNMQVALKDLEQYLRVENGLPPLIRIALVHAQFETIHPFLDGNGRMGRLLITFWLYYQGILTQPLLYLSNYFKENKDEYYQKLMDVRFEGKWEEWIAFFLQGVIAVSDEAVSSAKSILELKERGQQKLNERIKNNSNYMRMFEYLFSEPIINRADVMDLLGVSAPTATNVVNVLVQLGILVDITPERKRKKLYSFRDYYEILSKGTEL